MTTVPYTEEDSLIICGLHFPCGHKPDSNRLMVVAKMIAGDWEDARCFEAREEAKEFDREFDYLLEEQMNEWWEAQDEAMSWDADDNF